MSSYTEPLLRGEEGHHDENADSMTAAAAAAAAAALGAGSAATTRGEAQQQRSARFAPQQLQPQRRRPNSGGSASSSRDGAAAPPPASLRAPSTGSVLPRTASAKLLRLASSNRPRRALEEEEGVALPRWVAHPHDRAAYAWAVVMACAVLVAAAVEPYFLAFARYPGFYPFWSPDTLLPVAIVLVYAADIAFNFCVSDVAMMEG